MKNSCLQSLIHFLNYNQIFEKLMYFGPLLFTILLPSLGQSVHRYEIHFHCYVDDTHLYVLKPGTIEALCITPCHPRTGSTWKLSSSMGAQCSQVTIDAHVPWCYL